MRSPWQENQRRWNWVGFVCAFRSRHLHPVVTRRAAPCDLLTAAVVASVSGVLEGTYGDRFWYRLIRMLRWP